jgi:hypothetical protein
MQYAEEGGEKKKRQSEEVTLSVQTLNAQLQDPTSICGVVA